LLLSRPWQAAIFAAAVLLGLLVVGKVPLRYTLRNLQVRWKTTLLTALAFTLVVSLLTVMLAFLDGMQRLTEGTGQPDNVLVLADGATDEAFSNLGVTDLADIENQPQVQRAGGRPLASRETYLIVNQPIQGASAGQAKRRFLQLRGLDDPLLAARIHNLELLPGGSWFSEAGVQELSAAGGAGSQTAAIQAVLGEGAARELSRDRTPEQVAAAGNRRRLEVGDAFQLGNRPWVVVGIMRSEGSTFGSEVWAKRSLIASLFGKDTYTTLVLRIKDSESPEQFKEFLNKQYKKAPVAAQVETDYYASLSETNKQFLYAIAFVTVVMAIGGVFGVMNTMFAAISQRIKDIGVLRLLGYARRQILLSLLVESLLIALAGGVLGCAVGSLADGWSATSVVAGAGAGKSVALRLVVDADILASGLLLSLAMGAIGGLVPALSALRLSPLEALR
jgi:hypothetical protein